MIFIKTKHEKVRSQIHLGVCHLTMYASLTLQGNCYILLKKKIVIIIIANKASTEKKKKKKKKKKEQNLHSMPKKKVT
jgi:hypothetical protein